MKTGIVVFAHGSRVESANESVRLVAEAAAREGGFELVETAFLDCTRPDLGDAVASLAGRGASRILVIPFFLTLGTHLQRDLPQIVARLAAAHPGLEIRASAPLEGHPALSAVVVELAQGTLASWK